jgi:hypothetical protein
VRLVGSGRNKEMTVEIRVGETHSEIVDLSQSAPTRRRARR